MLKIYKKIINFPSYLRKLPMNLYNQDKLIFFFWLVKENKTKASLAGIIERNIFFFFCLLYLRIEKLD